MLSKSVIKASYNINKKLKDANKNYHMSKNSNKYSRELCVINMWIKCTHLVKIKAVFTYV